MFATAWKSKSYITADSNNVSYLHFAGEEELAEAMPVSSA